jgi:hypothetical protein
MGKQYDHISDKYIDFIIRQHLYIVATGMGEGRINVSPKGLDSLRIVDPNHSIPRIGLSSLCVGEDACDAPTGRSPARFPGRVCRC